MALPLSNSEATAPPLRTRPPSLPLQLEELGVPVDAGVDAHAYGPPDRLGHLALVHGAETRLARVLDVAQGGRKV